MDVDVWASLPTDLLIDIFRRLDTGNVSSLRPRPDCFNPNLLLGFFYVYWYKGSNDDDIADVFLQRAPGLFESTLTAIEDDEPECLSSFIPAASAGDVDLSLYDVVLSSRDGFLLLDGRDSRDYLCLCNPLTGDFTFLPYPDFKEDTYVLVSGYDFDPPNNDPGVRILTMRMDAIRGRLGGYVTTVTYQLSTPTTAVAGETVIWEAVTKVNIKRCLTNYTTFNDTGVICCGAVHWLYESVNGDNCVLALHMGTGRTWTIEVPEQCQHGYSNVLAASRDGRITLVNQSTRYDKEIHVWVHIDGDQWTLQGTIDVVTDLSQFNTVFCPRSGWVLADVHEEEEELLIDVEGGSSKPITRPYAKDDQDDYIFRFPYEMDWSTYLSRMKHF
ncbi:unnamed protein product [Urochloa humidicola]